LKSEKSYGRSPGTINSEGRSIFFFFFLLIIKIQIQISYTHKKGGLAIAINPREHIDIRGTTFLWPCFIEEGRCCCSFRLQLLEGKKLRELDQKQICFRDAAGDVHFLTFSSKIHCKTGEISELDYVHRSTNTVSTN